MIVKKWNATQNQTNTNPSNPVLKQNATSKFGFRIYFKFGAPRVFRLNSGWIKNWDSGVDSGVPKKVKG